MKLIVGLGNPSKKYEKTRHNVGFMVLDKLAEDEKWSESKKSKLKYLWKNINETKTELIKPQTFMNESGYAVSNAAKKHNIKPIDIFLVHDDIDLPVGKIRIGKFESAAGHKGVQSVIDHLKTNDFIRFRIGIKNEKTDKQPAEKFVLKKFSRSEKNQINESIQKVIGALKLTLAEPLEKVKNQYN